MINIAEWFKNPPKSYPEEIRDVLTAETKDALKSVIVSDYMVYIFPYDNCQEKLGNINILMSCEEDGEERVYLIRGGKLDEGNKFLLLPENKDITVIL